MNNLATAQVLFRCDATAEMGTGHLMRCLTLAQALVAAGQRVAFLTQALPEGLAKRVLALGPLEEAPNLSFESGQDASWTASVLAKAPEATWLVLDHYRIGIGWQKEALGGNPAIRILCVDDLADRPLSANLLLNQNNTPSSHSRYPALLNESCQMLLGPRYALLRPEFAHARMAPSIRVPGRILGCFGGADPTQEGLKLMEAFKQLPAPELSLQLVVGAACPWRVELESLAAKDARITVDFDLTDLSPAMREATLAVGASGSMNWERCCLGLPSLLISVAPNQVESAEVGGIAGLWTYLGPSETVSTQSLAEAISSMLNAPDRLRQHEHLSRALVDGHGANRVVHAMLDGEQSVEAPSARI